MWNVPSAESIIVWVCSNLAWTLLVLIFKKIFKTPGKFTNVIAGIVGGAFTITIVYLAVKYCYMNKIDTDTSASYFYGVIMTIAIIYMAIPIFDIKNRYLKDFVNIFATGMITAVGIILGVVVTLGIIAMFR